MKNKIRTLIIDDDESVVDGIKQYFKNSEVISIDAVTKNGEEGLNYATNHEGSIDLIIMDTLLSKRDGLALLKEFKTLKDTPKIILTSSVKNNLIFSNVEDYNIKYVLLKPYKLEDLGVVIDTIYGNKLLIDKNGDLEARITKMLHSLGIPSHIKGYQYIRESVMLMYNNPYIIGGITKELYPEIANRFKTTSSRVERAIRHAIEVSWNRGDYDYMEELFGHSVDYDRAKPTNSEFIATVADKLRLDLKVTN